jgi:hypothetical protein
MEDLLLHIMACRKKGVTKKEFFKACDMFSFYVPQREEGWRRMLYRKKLGYSMGVYNEGKRWFSYENEYHRGLVKFINNNPKGILDMGMALGCVPRWIDENHSLFVKMFPLNCI